MAWNVSPVGATDMPHTFSNLLTHVIFSTKDRIAYIHQDWRDRLHAYLGGIVRDLGGVPEVVGGVEDHVHLLVGLRATYCLADFMQELKKASSVWCAKTHEPSFHWQDGYSAFTVSATHREVIKKYISGQEEHHKNLGFIDELKRLLEKNGVEYDPKYLV